MKVDEVIEDFGLYASSYLYAACVADKDRLGALNVVALSLTKAVEVAEADFAAGGIPSDMIIKITAKDAGKYIVDMPIFVGCGEGILV